MKSAITNLSLKNNKLEIIDTIELPVISEEAIQVLKNEIVDRDVNGEFLLYASEDFLHKISEKYAL